MNTLPNLHWLRAFEAAARLSSFTAAAEELHLTQAAVSHQVRSLEKTLGVLLFHRRSRHLEQTDIGRAYYPSVARALESLADSTRGLFGPSTQKTMTISAPISTAAYWLAPRINQYRAQNPKAQIRLLSALWADVVPDEHMDIDIRLGNGTFPGYTALKLSDEAMVPICSVETAKKIRRVEDLAAQDLIHIHGYQDHWASLFKELGLEPSNGVGGVSVDTTVTAIELARTGASMAMVMQRLARPLAALGQIAIPLGVQIPMGQAHYLLTPHAAPLPTAGVRAFRDWVIAEFTHETGNGVSKSSHSV
jgi:LysR family glycine cleavage system transcriptional activator